MKGFGTDEKTLIRVLATKDPLQVNVLRQTFNYRFSRDLIKDIKSETSDWFEEGLCGLARGPLQQDAYLLHEAMSGPGTKEMLLNDVLLGRSNADIRAIKAEYAKVYRRNLESDVKGDLSMKTERHFLMVLAANRNEESAPVIPQQIDADAMEIYKATEGKTGTDELLVCNILTQRSDSQIRAIAHTYNEKFRRDLETVIKKVRLPIISPLMDSEEEDSLDPNTSDRNSPVIWKTPSCTSFELVPIKRCVTPSALKPRCQVWGPRICYSRTESSGHTGTKITCNKSREPISIGLRRVLQIGSGVRQVAITKIYLLLV